MAAMTGRVGSGALLFFSVCSVAIAAQSASQDRTSAIVAALRARDYAAALSQLGPALQQSPADAQLWTFEALAYSGQGRKDEALTAFQKALQISPDYLPALEGAAQQEYESGGNDAEALLRRVVKQRPNDLTAHIMLATLAIRKHDCAEAVAQFEQCGSRLESQPSAMREYGLCQANLEQYEKAEAVFEGLAAQPGDDPRDLERLAAMQLALGRPADAVRTLEPALAGQPSAAVLSQAAEAYEEQKDTPKAVSLLHRAIVENPRDTDLYLQFADIAFVHQSFQVGVDMLTAGLKIVPDAAELYVARGVLYVQLADYDHGEADFEQAEKLDPQLTVSEAARGLVAEQQDDLDKALAVVEEKLREKPDDAMLLFVEADILAQRNPDIGSPEFERAVAAARRASQLQPGMTEAEDLLAKLDLQAGNNERAVDESRDALRQNPDDQSALYHLIVGLRRTGHKEELPPLLQRLAELRQKATSEEGEHNRYKLIEPSGADTAVGK
ncbi:MAG TPA: tetratricopeptide repeat protein [Terracidiphilus sp.]|nr:tetratricopeptide repeat protein [Terracidiphilus sp.]